MRRYSDSLWTALGSRPTKPPLWEILMCTMRWRRVRLDCAEFCLTRLTYILKAFAPGSNHWTSYVRMAPDFNNLCLRYLLKLRLSFFCRLRVSLGLRKRIRD